MKPLEQLNDCAENVRLNNKNSQKVNRIIRLCSVLKKHGSIAFKACLFWEAQEHSDFL